TSIAFAVLGGAMLAFSGILPGWARPVALIVAAACVQGRLVCNLLDGMVAVEHGEGSKTGAIWNELPDRLADLMFLVGAGYSAYGLGHNLGPNLGWMAGSLAILTAYVRELGRGMGFPADFGGPMAKPQRMAALTIVCVIAAFEPLWGGHGLVMVAGLIAIVIGTALTVTGRVARLARALAARP
ncbi:MAG TPA: CDP-alcohol phosphatidyltransferase family protein, partial [Caulobacteraceae bacterium]